MGTLQHRRSISIGPVPYARLLAHCKRRGLPLAAFVEACLADALDDEGAPFVDPGPTGYPKRKRGSKVTERDIALHPPAHLMF